MLLDNIAEQTKSTRNLYLIYVANLLYSVLTILSIRDIDLLKQSAVTLPILQVDVSTPAFFVLGPVALIVLFVYFNLHLLDLKSMTAKLKATEPEKLHNVFPWMITALDRQESKESPTIKRLIVRVALWWTLPSVLALFTFWILKIHDTLVSMTVATILLVGVITNIYFLNKYKGTLKFYWIYRLIRRRRGWSTMGCGILALGVWFAILGTCVYWINSGRSGLNVVLFNLDISSKPGNGDSTRPWAVLDSVNLNGATLNHAFLFRASLRNTCLHRASILNSNLQDAVLWNANLNEAVLYGTSLQGAELGDATLLNTLMIKTDLSSANLIQADMRGAMLNGCNLENAKLGSANLYRANLTDAILNHADLSQAELPSASMNNAELINADLWQANLTRADLRNADLTNADLSGANLTDADLTDAVLIGCKYSINTIFPLMFNPKGKGMFLLEN